MSFPLAGRPDIIRANQKDEVYKVQTVEMMQDVVRRLFGPRQAILRLRELDLVSRLIYSFTSTACNQQTPGEEYCDILQAAGRDNTAPGHVRRFVLSLLEACGPYIMEEIQILPEEHGDSSPAWKILAYLSQCLPWVLRLQLAGFYLSGIYYQWTHRLTGTKYLFVGRLYEPRPSYRFLGVLMCIQLAISAGSWALSQTRLSQQDELDEETGSKAAASLQKAVVLKPSKEGPPETQLSSHRCPLCLSPRDHPTATPCGHVFCWSCISSWADQKPECPLCRSPFTGSDLVCVHFSEY